MLTRGPRIGRMLLSRAGGAFARVMRDNQAPRYSMAVAMAGIGTLAAAWLTGTPRTVAMDGVGSLSATYSYAPPGQQAFTSTTTFVVPADVTSISAVCVGRGASRGGDLRYATSISVTPGETLDIEISASGGGPSRILRSGTPLLAARGGTTGTSTTTGGTIGGGNGGSAGTGSTGESGGYGGAGGYTGNGGNGGNAGAAGSNGAGGGGGGGGGSNSGGTNGAGGGGGGVGLLGTGSNGTGGAATFNGSCGTGGSSGLPTSSTQTQSGGNYGGGGSSVFGAGAVRIIWGAGRAYPSTGTADL